MAEPTDDSTAHDAPAPPDAGAPATERVAAIAAERPDERRASLDAEAPTAVLTPEPEPEPEPTPEPTRVELPAVAPHGATAAQPTTDDGPEPPPPAPVEPQEVPAVHDSAPPKRHGNRLFATAWVLLAAGLFEAIYLALLLLYILVEGGAAAVQQSLPGLLRSPFIWLPVLIFFVLYELTVLALGRAGRFAYVVTSLIVGVLVYLLSIALVLILQGGTSQPGVLNQALVLPQFILAGIVAREVMLWTGYAVGARGRRLRHRDRQAREEFDRGLDRD